MSLVNEDNNIQIKTLISEVSTLRNDITELKKIILELQYGKKRGPKKRKTSIVKDISLITCYDNKVELLINKEIKWKTTISTLDKIIYTLKHNSKYEIN
tara:strand:+ start:2665 stop:2961 length:297 start_codon:yes stop_codon:yes gene_type:complete